MAILEKVAQLGLDCLFYGGSDFKFICLINWVVFRFDWTKRLGVKSYAQSLADEGFLIDQFVLKASYLFEFGALLEHLRKGDGFYFLG